MKDLGKELGININSRVEEYKKAVIKACIDALPMLVEKSPVDTGQYAASWDVFVSELKVAIGNYAPHAAIIEYGARPFRPPIGPLLAWAKRVLKDPSQPPKYSSKVWALATATQKAIAARGLPPKHIMENALPDIIELIKQELLKVG
jgi:hypothetical protein